MDYALPIDWLVAREILIKSFKVGFDSHIGDKGERRQWLRHNATLPPDSAGESKCDSIKLRANLILMEAGCRYKGISLRRGVDRKVS